MSKTTKLLDYLAFEEKQTRQCLLKTVARCLASSNCALHISCQCCFIYGYKSLPHMHMIHVITFSSLKVTKVLQGDHYYLICKWSLILNGTNYFTIICIINNKPQPLIYAAALIGIFINSVCLSPVTMQLCTINSQRLTSFSRFIPVLSHTRKLLMTRNHRFLVVIVNIKYSCNISEVKLDIVIYVHY